MNPVIVILPIILFFLGATLILLFTALKSLLPLLFWGPPYAVSESGTVEKIIALSNVKPREKAADLGSGDGRIVIALAKTGAEAHGYEIDPWFVSLARKNIRNAGLEDKAFIHQKSFWKENFSEFDVITAYMGKLAMGRLEKKLQKELKENARVVSNFFTFPNWRYSKKEGNIYLYEKTI